MSVTSKMEGVMPMTIYAVLSGEHNEVQSMIALLESSPNALAGGTEPVYDKLRRELLSHSEAEEMAVYSRLEERGMEKESMQEARKEHTDIERHLDAMFMEETGSDAWKKHLNMLKEAVDHHVREEESNTFDRLKATFNDEETKDIAKEFQRLKEERLKTLKAEADSTYASA